MSGLPEVVQKILGMLERQSVDICFAKETRSKGKSVWMISGKATQYNFFWIGKEKGLEGVGIIG